MKFKLLIMAIAFLIGTHCFGQDVMAYGFLSGDTTSTPIDSLKFEWKKSTVYDLKKDGVWAVDRIGNLYTASNRVINKYDTTGVLKFSQSIKSFGEVEQILPINSMKVVQFSEEQQTLCYLDNTLTQLSDCIDLADRGFVNGALVSYSARLDMVWIYDDVNSKLVLLPLLENQQKTQEIENLKGILGAAKITQMIERDNQLYIVDEGEGIYIFDLYGSLIEYKEEKGVKCIDVEDGLLLILLEDRLKMEIMKLNEFYILPLPIKDIEYFQFANEQVFLRTSQHVHKFSLQKAK